MGAAKALLPWGNSTLVAHSLNNVLAADLEPVILVVGGAHGRAIAEEAASIAGVTVVSNPDPERGMLSSLQVGLVAALKFNVAGVLFAPVDLPVSGPNAVISLMAKVDVEKSDVVAAAYNEQAGHPVWVSRHIAGELIAAPENAIARELLQGYPSTLVPVSDPGVCGNVNTPDDVARWRPGTDDS
jgi:molybdenum cofactor cytidylyltransferase